MSIPYNILVLKYKEQNKLLEKALKLVEQAKSINDTIGGRDDMCLFDKKMEELPRTIGDMCQSCRAAVEHFGK